MTTNSNHQVTWLPTRPELTIRVLRGTSTNRGYHQTWYEIVSRVALDADDLKRLSECGLLGIGQAYDLEFTEMVTDTVPPVTINRLTGEVLPDVPLVNDYTGQPFTQTTKYEYQRYVVRRICDSGD